MNTRRLLALLGCILVVVFIATACSSATSTTTAIQTPTSKTTTTATVPTTTTSQKPIEIKTVMYKLPATLPEFEMGMELIGEIEKRSNGLIKFKVLGGPEVIPQREQQSGVSKGVVDCAFNPAADFANIMPEASAISLFLAGSRAERSSGYYDLMNELYAKNNIYYFGNLDPSIFHDNFYVLSAVPVKTLADLKGLKMRSAGTTKYLIEGFGGVAVGLSLSETYTALERKMVDGCPTTISSAFDYNLMDFIKCYVYPGYGHSQNSIFLNLDVWNSIPANLQKLMKDIYIELEPKYEKRYLEIYKEQLVRCASAGIERVEFSAVEGEKLSAPYYEGNWNDIIAKSKDNGTRLRDIAYKANASVK